MTLLPKSIHVRVPGVTREADAPDPATRVNAVLGAGARFEGRLVFEGTVHIDGEFHGTIVSKDALVIGPSGRVSGEVEVGHLLCSGHLDATVWVDDVLEVRAPAHVKGQLFVADLTVERGARLEAEVRMESPAGAAHVRPSKSQPPPTGPRPAPEAAAGASPARGKV